MSSIPDDLLPLSEWTKRLRMPARMLLDMAERSEFPQVYIPAPRVYRVSDSAVRRWLSGCTAMALAEHRRGIVRIARGEGAQLRVRSSAGR